MKLIKNYLMTSSYQLLIIILPIITTPYISRVLSPEGIGLYSYTYTITQYFVLFATLGTVTYGSREIAYYQSNKQKRSEIFWGITFLSWATGAISLLIFYIFIFFNGKYSILFFWQSFLIFGVIFDVNWYFTGMEKFKVIISRNFCIKIISLLCIFVFVKSEKDLSLYIVILGLSNIIGNILVWPYLRKEVYKPNFSKLSFKKHLGSTWIFFLPQTSVTLNSLINQNMIAYFDSITSLGYFTQTNKFTGISISIVISIGTVMLPRMSNLVARKEYSKFTDYVTKSINISSGISIAIMFGLMAIAPKFTTFFLGAQYKFVIHLLVLSSPIVVLVTWSNVLGQQYLIPLNRMKIFTISLICGNLVNVSLNLILLPKMGVEISIINQLINEIIIVGIQFISVRKEIKINIILGDLIKYFFAGIIMFIAVLYLNLQLPMTIFTLLIEIGIGVLIYSMLVISLKTGLYKELKKIIKIR